MDVLVVLIVVGVVAWLLMAPLRGGGDARLAGVETAERADLEARKEAKYREIRDAELDRAMGKLSDADWRVVDRELRAEAVELLRRLDALDGREGSVPSAVGR